MRTTKEMSYRARWSETLKGFGSTPISNVFLNRYSLLGISNQEAMFIIHCFKYKWTVDAPYPSLKTVAHLMGKNRGTVQGYARSLEKKGFLKRVQSVWAPSKLNFKPLIELLEQIAPYKDLDRETIEIISKRYRDSDT